jgi:superfamily II DNA or RNA helicase
MMKKTKADEAEVPIGEFIEDVVCVMVDEVHMAKADALKALMTGPFAQVPIRWGLTGTVPKAKFEFMSLFVSLGSVISKLSASELQDKGVLAQCHVNIVQLKDDVEFGNYQSELKYLTENSERLDAIAKLIAQVKDTGNTLILVDRISAGNELQRRLTDLFGEIKNSPDVAFVSGNTNLTERREEYDDFATATNKVFIATYGVAAVGINIPRIFNLVLLEPGKSFVRVIQSIGRGIRKAEDKDFVQIWDITSSCKFAKRHLTQRKTYYKEANYPFDIEKLTYK